MSLWTAKVDSDCDLESFQGRSGRGSGVDPVSIWRAIWTRSRGDLEGDLESIKFRSGSGTDPVWIRNAIWSRSMVDVGSDLVYNLLSEAQLDNPC